MNQKGFTLVEILITLGVLAIATIFAIPNLRRYNETQSFATAANDLVSTLRTAQTNAQSNIQCLTNSTNFAVASWRVTLTAGGYQMQCSDGANNSSPVIKNYPTGITLSTPSSSCALFKQNNIYFSNDCSLSSTAGPLTLTLTDTNLSGSNTKVINIEKGGSIYVSQ